MNETVQLWLFGSIGAALVAILGYTYAVQRSVWTVNSNLRTAIGDVRNESQTALSQSRNELKDTAAAHALEDARTYVPISRFVDSEEKLHEKLDKIADKLDELRRPAGH